MPKTVNPASAGVFGIEVAPTRAEEGISPAKMGIIGWTERGPTNTPIEVRSVDEFNAFFGPINPRGLTAISMRAFFGTGGQRAWVVRVVPVDALEASVDIDAAPIKWTFTANGAGAWGNDLVIQIEGNRNFLDRTAGAEAWTKFNLKVLQPTTFDPDILAAAETFEAIQFDDPLASDYIVAAMSDPRSPSLLTRILTVAGGTPVAFDRLDVTDLVIGTGDNLGTTQFVGTLTPVPLITETLRIVAADATVDDEEQSTGAVSGPNTLFTNPGVGATHDLSTTPATVDLPIIPGTFILTIDVGAGPVAQAADDSAGILATSAELPGGGTIDYNTGALTGVTDVLAAGSAVTESHTLSAVTPTIDNVATGFTFTLPTIPVLDGSLRIFAPRWPPVTNELVTVTGAIDDSNDVYTVAAGALSDKVHRETTIFRLKYAATGSSSGPNNLAAGVPAAIHDLSTTPLTVALPAHPGTVSIDLDIGAGPVAQVDDGAGSFPTTAELPAGGTVDYDSGALTGITAALLGASAVDETHNTSTIITKTSTGDNLEQGSALPGDNLVGVTSGDIDLVENVTAPTSNGLLSFTTLTTPTVGTSFFMDFVRLLIVSSDVDGNLTGDIGVGNNLADFVTGDVDVEFISPPMRGLTIDADYQTGQIALDDGLGNLVGDVDAAGTNTIDYETGEFDLTWDSAPPDGTAILANYVKLTRLQQYALSGGSNGTAVARSDISDPSLEDAREGIFAFDDVEDPLNMVVPDFEGSLFVQADIVDYCEARNTRFYIMAFANGTTKEEAVKYVLVDQAFDTKCAAIYWPNVFFVNETTNRPELLPVSAFVAGVYAKTAFNKNVGKSPAGIEDGALDANGTVGPEFGKLINDIRVRDDLYQSRINPLFNSDATGFVVWGARSLSTEFRWRYVNARLLHNFLMDAINRQLQWSVFENNGPQLWIKIETALKGFMGSLFRQGFFAGVTEKQAFFVVCNATNNNQSTVDEGRVIIDIGFSPFKPAEFIIFRLSQPASTITV